MLGANALDQRPHVAGLTADSQGLEDEAELVGHGVVDRELQAHERVLVPAEPDARGRTS